MVKRSLVVFFGALLLVGSFWFMASPGIGGEKTFGSQGRQILKNQEKILQDLELIKKDLVKIRVRVN